MLRIQAARTTLRSVLIAGPPRRLKKLSSGW